MLTNPPWFVWALALTGCFTDSGGASMTNPDASTSTTSGGEATTGTTGGPGVTSTGATTPTDTTTDALTTDATTTTTGAASVTTSETGGTDAAGSSGEACAPLAQLAMTANCVMGLDIASEDWGNTRCEEEFGAGWTWMEHHYQGGWDVEGIWTEEASLGLRGWIQVTDQNSECFSSGGSIGVTWVHAACVASCHPGCDPYVGDTACGQCLSLICVGAI